jgi:hypothetical protein
MSKDIQMNFCTIDFQYKAETASSWSAWKTILNKEDTSDYVDAKVVDINLSLSDTYKIRLRAIDEVGDVSYFDAQIPTADVTMHLRNGGKGAAFGKYAEKDYCLDIDEDWELNVRGVARVGEALHTPHIGQIDAYSHKNFDELIYKTGYYTGSSAPSSVSATNYPINETGVLEVISAMGQNSETLAWWGFAYQTYRTHTGLIYVRSYFSGTGWTAWKKVTLS